MPLVLGLRPCGGPLESFRENGAYAARRNKRLALPPSTALSVSASSPKAFTSDTGWARPAGRGFPHHASENHLEVACKPSIFRDGAFELTLCYQRRKTPPFCEERATHTIVAGPRAHAGVPHTSLTQPCGRDYKS